jgi:hypothetical protein
MSGMQGRGCVNFFGFALVIGCGGGGASGDESSSSGATATSGATSGGSASTTGTGEVPTTGGGSSTGAEDPCVASPQALADCVDAAAYKSDLEFIADLRVPGTPHWQEVQDLCADRLNEYGYQVALQDYGSGVNVVGRKVGSKPGQVVIGAHYDHIEGCHGADDNASGVAATLEIARLLALPSFEQTVLIGCWDEEEDGLIGSKAYVAAAQAGKDEILINYNFDMIGFRSDEANTQQVPEGFSLVFSKEYNEIEANEFRGDFIAAVASSLAHDRALEYKAAAERVGLKIAVLELPAGTENTDAFNDLRRSDHASFWEAGYPAVFLTDTGEFRNQHYHCMGGPDEVADLDLEFAVAVTKATVEASAVALKM